nr:MAG TPA: TFIIB zinc-binding [Caudoviricetes sp.]
MKCKKCGQTLLIAEYVKGEIKCPRCKCVNRVEIKQQREEHRQAPFE